MIDRCGAVCSVSVTRALAVSGDAAPASPSAVALITARRVVFMTVSSPDRRDLFLDRRQVGLRVGQHIPHRCRRRRERSGARARSDERRDQAAEPLPDWLRAASAPAPPRVGRAVGSLQSPRHRARPPGHRRGAARAPEGVWPRHQSPPSAASRDRRQASRRALQLHHLDHERFTRFVLRERDRWMPDRRGPRTCATHQRRRRRRA